MPESKMATPGPIDRSPWLPFCAPAARLPQARQAGDAAMLYRGRERLNIDGIWCLPVGDFLREMVPGAGLLEWASG